MPFESHPKNLSADEARLLHSARLMSAAARNTLLVEAGKRLAFERIPEVIAAVQATERGTANSDAEGAVQEAFDDFLESHLPNLDFHPWARNMADYYGRYGLYEEVLKSAFDGDVAEVIFGSQDADETNAAALDCIIDYKIQSDSLGSSNPWFSGKWELPLENVIDFIREWRAAVQAALEAL